MTADVNSGLKGHVTRNKIIMWLREMTYAYKIKHLHRQKKVKREYIESFGKKVTSRKNEFRVFLCYWRKSPFAASAPNHLTHLTVSIPAAIFSRSIGQICNLSPILAIYCLLISQTFDTKPSARRQKGLTGYCFKYIDRPFCLWTDNLYWLKCNRVYMGAVLSIIWGRSMWVCNNNAYMTVYGMYCHDLEVMSSNPDQVELRVQKSLMAGRLEQAFQWHGMYCHDLEVMSSNHDVVELGVQSTSVLSRTWTKNIISLPFLVILGKYTT